MNILDLGDPVDPPGLVDLVARLDPLLDHLGGAVPQELQWEPPRHRSPQVSPQERRVEALDAPAKPTTSAQSVPQGPRVLPVGPAWRASQVWMESPVRTPRTSPPSPRTPTAASTARWDPRARPAHWVVLAPEATRELKDRMD